MLLQPNVLATDEVHWPARRLPLSWLICLTWRGSQLCCSLVRVPATFAQPHKFLPFCCATAPCCFRHTCWTLGSISWRPGTPGCPLACGRWAGPRQIGPVTWCPAAAPRGCWHQLEGCVFPQHGHIDLPHHLLAFCLQPFRWRAPMTRWMRGWSSMAGSASRRPSAQVGRAAGPLCWRALADTRRCNRSSAAGLRVGHCVAQHHSLPLVLTAGLPSADKQDARPYIFSNVRLRLPPMPAGALSQEEAAPALQAAMDAVHAALAKLPPAVGTATLRLQVAGDGRPVGLQWLCNTVRVGRGKTGATVEQITSGQPRPNRPGCRHASQADSVAVVAVDVAQCSAPSPPHHSPFPTSNCAADCGATAPRRAALDGGRRNPVGHCRDVHEHALPCQRRWRQQRGDAPLLHADGARHGG